MNRLFSDQINLLPFRSQKTLVICNEFEEAELVAKHLELQKIPVELVKNIESNCKLLANLF